jgi:hypothetical protein
MIYDDINTREMAPHLFTLIVQLIYRPFVSSRFVGAMTQINTNNTTAAAAVGAE